MKKSIPDRWLQYKPFGEVIKGTKILPFKVPLKEDIANKVEAKQRFTPSILLQAFPRLKYIVDLTNTDRYYDPKEFIDAGVKYIKIYLPGKTLPPLNVVKRFFKAMDDFSSSRGEDAVIGVHCTHGINRTGYLICRYLVQQLGWDNEEALKAFEKARGYPIEYETYVNDVKVTKRGDKIDTSKVSLGTPATFTNSRIMRSSMQLSLKSRRSAPYSMGPPGFAPPHRGFMPDGPFPPQHFGFGGPPPGFRPVPPPPGMPPIPPPPGPPMYGPRPLRYGPPMRPAMPPPPPGPGFPIPGCPRLPGPPMMPGPPLMPGPSRLPPGAPPRLPPPPKKPQMTNSSRKIHSKVHKEQDFTVDTFEENLLAVSTLPFKRSRRSRFHRSH